jgi:hypothetical protein
MVLPFFPWSPGGVCCGGKTNMAHADGGVGGFEASPHNMGSGQDNERQRHTPATLALALAGRFLWGSPPPRGLTVLPRPLMRSSLEQCLLLAGRSRCLRGLGKQNDQLHQVCPHGAWCSDRRVGSSRFNPASCELTGSSRSPHR